jgi:hypothetical protein
MSRCRFGSLADIVGSLRYVRFAPNSGQNDSELWLLGLVPIIRVIGSGEQSGVGANRCMDYAFQRSLSEQ